MTTIQLFERAWGASTGVKILPQIGHDYSLFLPGYSPLSFRHAVELYSHASGPVSTRCCMNQCCGKANTALQLAIPCTYEDFLARCTGIPSQFLSWWCWHDLQCCSCPQPRHRLRSCRCRRKWSPHAHSACQLSRTKISRMSPNTQRRASTPQV